MSLDPETFDALIDTVRRFVAERLRPLEERVAEDDEVPAEIVREMRELGLFGLSIPEAYGGAGLTMARERRLCRGVGPAPPAVPAGCWTPGRPSAPGARRAGGGGGG